MEAFIGQISSFAFPFPPRGWAACDGATLSIQQNQALYSLLGTTFGGNGTTTFNLPDLRGRAAAHVGAASGQGQTSGHASVVLTGAQMPPDAHQILAVSETGDTTSPAGKYLAATDGTTKAWGDASATPGSFAAAGVTTTGGNQPHENQQPYLAINFCIALTGVYPSRN